MNDVIEVSESGHLRPLVILIILIDIVIAPLSVDEEASVDDV